MSALLNKNVAIATFRILKPSITAFLEERGKFGSLYLAILDPAITRSAPWPEVTNENVHEAILSFEVFGKDQDQWPAGRNFEEIALGKALETWRTGRSSIEVQRMPQLWTRDSVKYGGSVLHNGIIACASGEHWVFDHSFALSAASIAEALCLEQADAVLSASGHRVGDALRGMQKA